MPTRKKFVPREAWNQPGPGPFGEEKSLGVAGGGLGARRGGHRLGEGEGVRSSRVTLQSLDFVLKSRKQHGQLLGGHCGCPWGWAGGAGLQDGRPLDGAWPGEEAAEEGNRIGALFGQPQAGLPGRPQEGRVR